MVGTTHGAKGKAAPKHDTSNAKGSTPISDAGGNVVDQGQSAQGAGMFEDYMKTASVEQVAVAARLVFSRLTEVKGADVDTLRRELSTDRNVIHGTDVLRQLISEPAPKQRETTDGAL